MNYRYYCWHKPYRGRKWHRHTITGPKISLLTSGYVAFLVARDGRVRLRRCKNQSAYDNLNLKFLHNL